MPMTPFQQMIRDIDQFITQCQTFKAAMQSINQPTTTIDDFIAQCEAYKVAVKAMEDAQ